MTAPAVWGQVMRFVEEAATRLRATARAARAAAGLSGGGPARADLRLRGEGCAADLPVWQERLAELVRWRGALPVQILAEDDAPAADPALVAAVGRAAHRMDCPVRCRWGGGALNPAEALALVDAGFGAIEVLLRAPEDPNLEALRALAAARARRGGGPALHVAVRWEEAALPQLAPLVRAALEAGAGRARLAPPLRARGVPATERWAEAVAVDPARVEALGPCLRGAIDQMFAADDGLAGAPGGRRCPVGGLRVELGADGSACACPHHGRLWGPRAPGAGAELPALWRAGRDHRAAISACTRRCPAIDLRPPWA